MEKVFMVKRELVDYDGRFLSEEILCSTKEKALKVFSVEKEKINLNDYIVEYQTEDYIYCRQEKTPREFTMQILEKTVL